MCKIRGDIRLEDVRSLKQAFRSKKKNQILETEENNYTLHVAFVKQCCKYHELQLNKHNVVT